MIFVLVLRVRDDTAGAGHNNVSSFHTEGRVRIRSPAPSFPHNRVWIRHFSKEKIRHYLRISMLMRWETGEGRDKGLR